MLSVFLFVIRDVAGGIAEVVTDTGTLLTAWEGVTIGKVEGEPPVTAGC